MALTADHNSTHSDAVTRRSFDYVATWLTSFSVFYLTGLIVALAVSFGVNFVKKSEELDVQRDYVASAALSDGLWYKQIADHGYSYDPAGRSSVAFFPLYPLISRGVARIAGVNTDVALLTVSNLSFLAALVMLCAYMKVRQRGEESRLADYSLLATALFPTACFFRLAYSESTTLLLLLIVCYGYLRRWPIWSLALIGGLATATRAVGVASLVPITAAAWLCGGSVFRRACRLAFYLPVSCWGLLAFMCYQHFAFGDAFAFAKTQKHWQIAPPIPWDGHILALLTLDPIRSVFDAASPTNWATRDMCSAPWHSLHFANPLLFLSALALTVTGWIKRWLSPVEIAIATLLLLIPYSTRGYEMGMASMGRFALVAFPVSIAAAHLLTALPLGVVASLVSLSSMMMFTYTSLFSAGYLIF